MPSNVPGSVIPVPPRHERATDPRPDGYSCSDAKGEVSLARPANVSGEGGAVANDLQSVRLTRGNDVLVVGVADGDVPYLYSLQLTLNDAVERAAKKTGTVYVDVPAASAGHDAFQGEEVRRQGTPPARARRCG